jgi:hypothetical protein
MSIARVGWILRFFRESAGVSTLDYALGAAIIVGAAVPLAGGVQRSFGGTARRADSALQASAASSRSVSDPAAERQRRIDELAKEVERRRKEAEELREEAEAAADEGGFWDSLGSLFGGEVVGSQIGSAIDTSAEPSQEAAGEAIDRATLTSDAVAGWSDDDD